MKVSVIATVKDEGSAIRPLLESLMSQTRQPDEVIVCDGGSTDNTVAILETYQQWLPLKIVHWPGSNISQGRNRAVEAAAGPVIAATDAGVTLAPNWLFELIRPIEDMGAAAVSGWFEADAHSDFEVVMGATVLPAMTDVNSESFLASSRSVAFLKEAWQAVGGYPEWLDYCEDLVFDLALREKYGPLPFAPAAVAYFRPRGTFPDFARQYYRYARGDGKANLWPKRHVVRYLTYLVTLPWLGRWIWQGKMWGWFFLILGTTAYCRRPSQRLWPATRTWPLPKRLGALALIPLIRLVGDLAKMVGYPVGLVWRWKRDRANESWRLGHDKNH